MRGTRHHDHHIESLADLSLFRRCSERELVMAGQVTTPASLQAGAVVCREGEVGREPFVSLAGDVAVTVGGEEVATLGQSAVFGEMAVPERGFRSATVTSVTDVQVLVLSVKDFDLAVRTSPGVSRRLPIDLSTGLRRLKHAESVQ